MRPLLRPILNEVRDRLAALYGDRLVRVVLYGSEARDEAGPDSDIDVLVVLRGEVNHLVEIKRMARIGTEVMSQHGEWLSLHPYAEEAYHDLERPFMMNLHEEGIEL